MGFELLAESRFGDDFQRRELEEFRARGAAGEIVLGTGTKDSSRQNPEASIGGDPFYGGPTPLGNMGLRGTGLQFMPEQSDVIA